MTKAMEAMTSVDTAWLRMDQDTNHMMITGVLILGSAPGTESF